MVLILTRWALSERELSLLLAGGELADLAGCGDSFTRRVR